MVKTGTNQQTAELRHLTGNSIQGLKSSHDPKLIETIVQTIIQIIILPLL
jgi:hypothetical protein